MGLSLFFPFEKCRQPLFACLEIVRAQPSAKQLVAKPDAIGVHDIGLAVIGDFMDFAVPEVPMHLPAVDAVGLAGQAKNFADLVQRRLALRAERRQRVAKIERVFGVAVEIRPRRKAGSRHFVDHRPVTKDRQVEAVAVKSYELRRKLGDLVDKGRNQLLFGSVADMRRAKRIHHPGPVVAMGDERADADDRVIDMFGNLSPIASRTSSSVLVLRPFAAA